MPNANGYQINETQPAGVNDGKDSLGTLGGELANDQISQIIFADHLTHATDYNFGELIDEPAQISGKVWLDSNHNRIDDDGNGLEGWIVELIDSRSNPKDNGAITPIASVITNEQGEYLFDGLSPGNYEVRFIHPDGGILYGYPVSTEPEADVTAGTIANLTLDKREHITKQNLPIDPSGLVYNSKTREPVAGATVTISGPSGFDAERDLVGGQANVSQITADDGLYQFLLFNSAPAGTYELTVVEPPAGYLPGVSTLITACSNTPNIVEGIAPALVQANDHAPMLTATIHEPNSCVTSSADFIQGEQSTQYYLRFNIDPQLPSANVVNNHIPVDPIDTELFSVVKTTTVKHANRGDFIPYTITATNNTESTLSGMEVVDQLPAGFKYVQGSASINGVEIEPQVNGRHLAWPQVNFEPAQMLEINLLTVVGSGVGEGEYVNQAWVSQSASQILVANVASATVRIVPDPIFDCSDISGKVFDDKNANGYQDADELGLPAIRLVTAQGLLVTTDQHGRYHIACAAVPNTMRGSNFVVKLDDRTLPSGFRITTENPRVVRLTRGKMVKANFGATIHRVVRIQLNAQAFDGDDLTQTYQQSLNQAVKALTLKPSILRLAYQQSTESRDQVDARLEQLQAQIETLWQDCDCQYELMIEQEVTLNGDDLKLVGQTKGVGHE